MTADKVDDKKQTPAPPVLPPVDPETVSDTRLCRMIFHTHAVMAYRNGLSAHCVIAGLEAELAAWRAQFPQG